MATRKKPTNIFTLMEKINAVAPDINELVPYQQVAYAAPVISQ